MKHDRTQKRAVFWKFPHFTLLELLVVIGIISLLAALLLPALSRAKEKAHQVGCLSNHKQLATAVISYACDHNNCLPVSTRITPLMGYTYWKVEVAPYLGIDNPETSKRLGKGVFVCPSWKLPAGYEAYPYTYYEGSGSRGGTGWNWIYLGYVESSRKKVTDVSQPGATIEIGDCTDWYNGTLGGAGWHMSTIFPPSYASSLTPPVGNRHSDGICAAMVDGHAEWSKRATLMMGKGGDVDWHYRAKGGAANK